MKQTIFITGTPCTGKTTLADNLNYKTVKINQIAIENNLILGTDQEKGYKIIDIPALNEKVSQIIEKSDETLIFEGHLSHLCSHADKVIVLRLNPEILESRLKKRNYSQSKINENLEAEAIGVCANEAYADYGDKVQEIDVSNLSVEEIVNLVENIINDTQYFPFGEIDFTSWILNH